jgi:hypothetical protein
LFSPRFLLNHTHLLVSYQVIVCRVDREQWLADASQASRYLDWTKIHHLGRLAEGVQKVKQK